jgi:hypothetical protein
LEYELLIRIIEGGIFFVKHQKDNAEIPNLDADDDVLGSVDICVRQRINPASDNEKCPQALNV